MASESRSAASHKSPRSSHDFDFFYAGLERSQLLVQRCEACGALRNPPGPACPVCRSLRWVSVPLSGRGTIYSYTVHHHPPLPDFPVPHPVALVEMIEGVRVLGAMDGTDPQSMCIGAAVDVQFLRRGVQAAFRFKLS